MTEVQLEPGQVVASGRNGRDEREYCFQARRIQKSCQEYEGFAGSLGSPWIIAGFELCSRLVGSQAWQSEGGPLHRTLPEALRALAEDLEFPDRLLIHPQAISWRHEVRQRAEAAAEGAVDGDAGEAAAPAEEAAAEPPDPPTS